MRLPSEIFHEPSFNARAEYERVKALYDAYPLKAEDKAACDEYTIKLMKKIVEGPSETPSARFLNECYSTLYGLYELEILYASPPSEPHLGDKYYSGYLARTARQYSMERLKAADEIIIHFFRGLLECVPPSIFVEPDDPDAGTPLIQLVRTPNDLITGIYVIADLAEHQKIKIFDNLGLQLWKNALSTSGLTREEALTDEIKKFKHPWHSDLPPLDRCTAYLRDTPFLELFTMPLPFEIPTRTRFEHHWIVAPPGAGKSTTFQHFIMRDLDLVADNKASIVVMESNRDLIKAIEGLRDFAPGQRLDGKLVVIDAEDVEWPVALNLFDVGMDESRSYSAADREAFRNAVLAQYEYIFSALLSAEFTS